MLLLKITHNSTTYRFSTTDKVLARQWHGDIAGIDPIRLAIPTRHGGFRKIEAGRIRFLPRAFGKESWSIPAWPPPTELAAAFIHEVTSETILEAKLCRVSMSEKEVVYDVYIASYDENVAAGTSLASWPTTNTLIGFFTKVCSVLGLTLDSSKATTSPPALSHTLSNERLVIDVASEVAASCNHLFWIDDGTLYLQEMSATNGTLALTNPNDFFRAPRYSDDIPVNSVIAGAYDYTGSEFPYGIEYYLPASFTGNNSQLQVVYDYVNAQWVEVAMPPVGCETTPGKVVTLHDERLPVPSEVQFALRNVSYDFEKHQVRLAGDITSFSAL